MSKADPDDPGFNGRPLALRLTKKQRASFDTVARSRGLATGAWLRMLALAEVEKTMREVQHA
jgi:hypothetical protein